MISKFIKKKSSAQEEKKLSIQERIDAQKRTPGGNGSSFQIGPAEPTKSPRTIVSPEPDSDIDEASLQEYIQKIQAKPIRRDRPPEDELRQRTRQFQEFVASQGSSLLRTKTNDPLTPSAPAADPLPAEGTLLHIGTGEIAIFIKDVPNKGYQLVYMLNQDGTLSTKGIYLSAYEYEKIGSLPAEVLEGIAQSLQWNRDLIIYHLDSYNNAALIPHYQGFTEPISTPQEPESSSSTPVQARIGLPMVEKDKNDLARGRRIKIVFGKDREWEAVYWGKDAQGYVVAHNSAGHWTLMHLDIDRFRETLTLLEMMSENEVRNLGEELLKSHA